MNLKCMVMILAVKAVIMETCIVMMITILNIFTVMILIINNPTTSIISIVKTLNIICSDHYRCHFEHMIVSITDLAFNIIYIAMTVTILTIVHSLLESQRLRRI